METSIFWVALGILMFAYMTLWYDLARYLRRYDVVDTAWGLGFVLVAWVSLTLQAHFGALQVLSAVLVSVWGLRLSIHLARRGLRRGADDHRYEELRQKWERAPYKAYTHIFLSQGLLILLVSLPMIAVAFSSHGPNVLTYLGWIVWVYGIMFETIADWQLSTFLVHRPKGSHAIMQSGLWRYSRHPNYFGEVSAWWGAAIVSLSAGEWWGVFGAVLITILITKVSGIPPLEKHYRGNAAYATYSKRTSVLVPLRPKTNA